MHSLKAQKTLDKQTSAGEQHQRENNLGDDEEVAVVNDAFAGKNTAPAMDKFATERA